METLVWRFCVIGVVLGWSGVVCGGAERMSEPPQGGDFNAKLAKKINQVDCQFALIANGLKISQWDALSPLLEARENTSFSADRLAALLPQINQRLEESIIPNHQLLLDLDVRLREQVQVHPEFKEAIEKTLVALEKGRRRTFQFFGQGLNSSEGTVYVQAVHNVYEAVLDPLLSEKATSSLIGELANGTFPGGRKVLLEKLNEAAAKLSDREEEFPVFANSLKQIREAIVNVEKIPRSSVPRHLQN